MDDFLLFLRPEMDFDSQDSRHELGLAMNAVAREMTSLCDQKLVHLHIPGISNEPVGLRAPYVLQTLEWILITVAQEILAQRSYGMPAPYPNRDLLGIYQSGHILCGYDDEDERIVLY